LTDLKGESGRTISTSGPRSSSTMGTRSVAGSKGIFLNSVGLTDSGAKLPMPMV
jgi:hypothetical protein